METLLWILVAMIVVVLSAIIIVVSLSYSDSKELVNRAPIEAALKYHLVIPHSFTITVSDDKLRFTITADNDDTLCQVLDSTARSLLNVSGGLDMFRRGVNVSKLTAPQEKFRPENAPTTETRKAFMAYLLSQPTPFIDQEPNCTLSWVEHETDFLHAVARLTRVYNPVGTTISLTFEVDEPVSFGTESDYTNLVVMVDDMDVLEATVEGAVNLAIGQGLGPVGDILVGTQGGSIAQNLYNVSQDPNAVNAVGVTYSAVSAGILISACTAGAVATAGLSCAGALLGELVAMSGDLKAAGLQDPPAANCIGGIFQCGGADGDGICTIL